MSIATDETEPEYLYDTGTDLGREQLECLELLLNDHTVATLDAIGVRPGDRCLEIGAGTGSIARRLSDRTQPGGRVIAVDIEIGRMTGGPGIDVRRHDINHGVPDGGPFDLIHARLVLMHLRRRREIVAELIDALAPGGWLVLGEYGPPLEVVSAPSPADADLFGRVMEVAHNQVVRPGGMSLEWSREADDYLVQAGLMDVQSHRHTETVVGGGTGAILLRNYILQLDSPIRAAGITGAELSRFHDLMADPRFRTWFYEYTCTRGRKPAG